jgi:MFS family permease
VNITRLVRRYVSLYAVFGLIVGLGYGANPWVVQKLLGADGARGKHLFMATAMLGMLVGEFSGAWLSDRRGRRSSAVVLAVVAYSFSAVMFGSAVWFDLAMLLFPGALLFGLGLGIQHSSLDAWFSAAIRGVAGVKPNDVQFAWGFTAYTSFFCFGQALTFPLLYRFDWEVVVAEKNMAGIWAPTAASISIAPYVLTLVIGLLICVAYPPRVAPPAVDPKQTRPSGYYAVLKRGGLSMLLLVATGAGISFLIQHIDAFAATDLLTDTPKVLDKALSLAALHGAAAIAVGTFGWTLERSRGFNDLSPGGRTWVIGISLMMTVFLIAAALYARLLDALPIYVALLVGLAHSLLNVLPQVVKKAILDLVNRADQSTGSAVLGYAKRIPNLILSLLFLPFRDSPSNTFMYYLLMCVGFVCLLFIVGYGIRSKRQTV